jgi:hypothetical protein
MHEVTSQILSLTLLDPPFCPAKAAQFDLALAEADAPAMGDLDRAVV